MGGRFASALFGSTLRVVLAVVGVLVVGVAGGVALGVLGVPSVAEIQNEFGEVTDETTEIETDLVVDNPNPVGVTLGGVSVDYDVRMNDVALANGTKEGVSIESGNSTLSFTSEMRNDRIPAWWVSHVRNGEQTTVEMDATVRSGALGRNVDAPPVERQVSTDLLSEFNSTEPRPVNVDQPLVSDPVAYVNETSAEWGAVTRAETPMDVRMVVYNAKTVPMAIMEIGYTVTMNGVTVGNGTSQDEHVVEGHTTETIRTTTVIDNDKLDEWWVTHLENDQVTDLRIEFYAEVDVAGETVRVPLEEVTYTETIETDIFGTKNESGGPGASDSDGDASDGTTDSGAEESADSENGETTDSENGETTDTGGGTTGAEDEGTTDDGNDGTTESGDDETTDDGIFGGDGTTTDDGILARGPELVR